jgi:hypothetical protein
VLASFEALELQKPDSAWLYTSGQPQSLLQLEPNRYMLYYIKYLWLKVQLPPPSFAAANPAEQQHRRHQQWACSCWEVGHRLLHVSITAANVLCWGCC